MVVGFYRSKPPVEKTLLKVKDNLTVRNKLADIV
jgi:hypothetical protein